MRKLREMGWRIGVDTGGTFTDVVAVQTETGKYGVVKVRSTPKDPAEGFINGVRKVMDVLDISPGEIETIFHGTTATTNAILEGGFGRIGLIVTEGYQDILEIARQTVPGEFGNYILWVKPDRVVPRERVFSVKERINFKGEVIVSLDEDRVKVIAEGFKKQKVDAVAVCLLNSYGNPVHEKRVKEILEKICPGIFVSISYDVLPEFREWERTITTCLNAALMPVTVSYFERVNEKMREGSIKASLYVMKSSAGVCGPTEASLLPIGTALSGPAAGVVAANNMSGIIGKNIITFDMGGTSTDVSLITESKIPLLTEGTIDVYPIKTPMVHINTIGAGGGSIAWVGPEGSLRVGPQSAGAVPGPACYGMGGTEATITDAELFLGRIPPYLLGGDVKLNMEKAEAAIRNVVDSMRMGLTDAARAILLIATENIANAIRVVSIRQGYNPSDYVLLAFGGGGGMFAVDVAETLGIKRCCVPLHPGIFSAQGLLMTDITKNYVRTCIRRENVIDLNEVRSIFSEMEAEALAYLESENIPRSGMRIIRSADLRYESQAYEVNVDLSGSQMSDGFVRDLIERYHNTHQILYGYSYKEMQWVELVNLRLNAVGILSKPTTAEIPLGGKDPKGALKGTRNVYFAKQGNFVETKIYDRSRLLANNIIKGPAIIEQYDSTTVIDHAHISEIDKLGNINIDI